MPVRVDVPPSLLQWARTRSGIEAAVWETRFPQYKKWLNEETKPTFKQLEAFARKTHTPIGYFFLETPPREEVPIPDFRTVGDRPVVEDQTGSIAPTVVSADLLDTLYTCQARQDWYREHQLQNAEEPLSFVARATINTSINEAADHMRHILDWSIESRGQYRDWDAALTHLRENAEAAGILVMISGIVGSNTHRKLKPSEFRGFALVDPNAAIVFVNGADSKSAQVFTLAHELAHIWLGQTALSDIDQESTQRFRQERWCNQVAAELLVPIEEFRRTYDSSISIREQLEPLAKRFLVSTQVILGQHEAAKHAFASAADSFLIAHAMVGNHKVVTHERAGNSRRKIKIPDAARAKNVDCLDPFEMLRREGARFVLDNTLIGPRAR